ncbi:hypothetical protein GVAMD_1146 [Gardnerella vaginalis AMD]|nr:hypothetical protein GVAMD_1146 [Gardnerella vaginalis AMD]EFH72177.1 hypothetical protein GV51_1305 [Gardnerella vaginalis 5-1]
MSYSGHAHGTEEGARASQLAYLAVSFAAIFFSFSKIK